MTETPTLLRAIRAIEPVARAVPETDGRLRVHLKSSESHEVDFSGIDGSSNR